MARGKRIQRVEIDSMQCNRRVKPTLSVSLQQSKAICTKALMLQASVFPF